jgi:hypothetical protein
MQCATVAIIASLVLAGSDVLPVTAFQQDLTIPVAQQEMRAFPGLPVPAHTLTVTDTIEVDGRWVATVDFAGTPAHVTFRRAGDKWVPAEMAYQRGWVPLAKGFLVLTEQDELHAQSLLRAMASGQFTYAAVCGEGFYARTLAALVKAPPGQADGFILKDMLPPPGIAFLERDHYRIEMNAPASPASPRSCNGVAAGASAQTWSVTARRQPGFAGKSYKMDAEGKLTETK